MIGLGDKMTFYDFILVVNDSLFPNFFKKEYINTYQTITTYIKIA